MKNHVVLLFIRKSLTDKYGHIGYKKYLDIFRRGQDGFMKLRGVSFKSLYSQYGIKTVVRSLSIDYMHQAFAREKLQLVTCVEKVGNSSFIYSQSLSRDGVTIAVSRTVAVMLGPNGSKIAIPEKVRQKISS